MLYNCYNVISSIVRLVMESCLAMRKIVQVDLEGEGGSFS